MTVRPIILPITITAIMALITVTLAFSDFFLGSNGLRQDGILSPMLFNVYLDDLSKSLSNSGIGCFIGPTCVNPLCYADD